MIEIVCFNFFVRSMKWCVKFTENKLFKLKNNKKEVLFLKCLKKIRVVYLKKNKCEKTISLILKTKK